MKDCLIVDKGAELASPGYGRLPAYGGGSACLPAGRPLAETALAPYQIDK